MLKQAFRHPPWLTGRKERLSRDLSRIQRSRDLSSEPGSSKWASAKTGRPRIYPPTSKTFSASGDSGRPPISGGPMVGDRLLALCFQIHHPVAVSRLRLIDSWSGLVAGGFSGGADPPPVRSFLADCHDPALGDFAFASEATARGHSDHQRLGNTLLAQCHPAGRLAPLWHRTDGFAVDLRS